MKYEILASEGSANASPFRIRALRDIPCHDVCKGSLGGFVEGEHNLSQEGDCWISGNASVLDTASVQGDALVSGDAMVLESAQVSGTSIVSGNASVYGYAQILDNATVYDNARVEGDAVIFESAKIFGDAEVYGNAHVFGDAEVSDSALVYEEARVYGTSKISGEAIVKGFAQVYGDARIQGRARLFGDVRVGGKATLDDPRIRAYSGKFYYGGPQPWETCYLVYSGDKPPVGIVGFHLDLWRQFPETGVSYTSGVLRLRSTRDTLMDLTRFLRIPLCRTSIIGGTLLVQVSDIIALWTR